MKFNLTQWLLDLVLMYIYARGGSVILSFRGRRWKLSLEELSPVDRAGLLGASGEERPADIDLD